MNKPKHLSTIYFYKKETDNVDIYDLYRDYNETTIKKEDTVIMTSSPNILFIDALKQIGYTEKDCVYWEYNSYCYDGWDITDIMKIQIINIPDIFDFYIGDNKNGVPYNEQSYK
jgi:hypothetical protein